MRRVLTGLGAAVIVLALLWAWGFRWPPTVVAVTDGPDFTAPAPAD